MWGLEIEVGLPLPCVRTTVAHCGITPNADNNEAAALKMRTRKPNHCQ